MGNFLDEKSLFPEFYACGTVVPPVKKNEKKFKMSEIGKN
jgi:hypothetical protein